MFLDSNYAAVRHCPSCKSMCHEVLISSKVEDLSESTFSGAIQWVCCDDCGFVYNNNLAASEYDKYYKEISHYHSASSYGTGGATEFDVQRYKLYTHYFDLLGIDSGSKIVDIGCGKGGFLHQLKSLGYHSISGIELDPRLVEQAKNLSLDVKLANAEDLADFCSDVDLICLSHILEHIYDFDDLLKGIYETLSDDGIVFIEVPDASNYKRDKVFDCFWFNMREHINHFSPSTLTQLFNRVGLVNVFSQQDSVSYGNGLTYPSLIMAFAKESSNHAVEETAISGENLKDAIKDYLLFENDALKQANSFYRSIAPNEKLALWGLGLEFFSHFSYTELTKLNITTLIDGSPSKYGKKLGDFNVSKPQDVSWPDVDTLIVFSSFRSKEIIDMSRVLGFEGKTITVTYD